MRPFFLRSPLRVAASVSAFVCAVLVTSARPSSAQGIIFDTITNQTGFNIPTATRTFIGDPVLAVTPTGGPVGITGFDLRMISTSAVTYNQIRVNVYFWNTINTTGTDAFSNLAGVVTGTVTSTAFTTQANVVYTLDGFRLSAPLFVNSPNFGVTVNYQGDTGSGFQNTDALTEAVVGNTATPFAVGSVAFTSPNYGYYRNASGRTDGNFSSTDGRNIGTNSAMAIRIFAAPEPGSIGLIAGAALPLLGAVVTRRRAVRK